MKFTKMHGCGNDYIYVNGFVEQIATNRKPELVRQLSDRHFGIGGDGVIFINPGKNASFEMEMYNADGTRAQMCGNGIRCVAKYVYDYGLTDQTSITIESFGQVKYLDLTLGKDGKVSTVRVNMGAPILTASEIPVVSENKQVIDEEITVDGQQYKMTCVSMGNPHAVIFLNTMPEDFDIRNFEIEKKDHILRIICGFQSVSIQSLCMLSTEKEYKCACGSGELEKHLHVGLDVVQQLLPVC